ncbi:MAG: ABC transporter permease [Actinobacteria bacterium]|nr:ABC transporter permease [Actinomycetota bacterium]
MTPALWRIARRSAWTSKRRSFLIVILIALAVAGAVAAAVGVRSGQVPLDQQLAARYGTADLRVDLFRHGVSYGDLPPQLQAVVDDRYGGPVPELTAAAVQTVLDRELSTRAEVLRYEETYLVSDEFDAMISTIDPTAGLAAGRLITPGPAPGPGETLVSPSLLEALDVGVGDRVELPGLAQLEVVGTAEPADVLGMGLAVVHPEDALPAFLWGRTTVWLVGGLGEEEAAEFGARLDTLLNRQEDPVVGGPAPPHHVSVTSRAQERGWMVESTQMLSQPPFVGAMVGAVLLAQVALVAAAAFATGTRRRLREFGLLSAGGASPRHVRALVLREAGVLGTVGALAGIVLGVVAVRFAEPLIEAFTARPLAGYRWHVADLVVPALVGVVAAVAAAYLPARTVARVPVVAALAGRAPIGRVPRWVAPLALVASASGLLLLGSVIRSARYGSSRSALIALGTILAIGGAAGLASPIIGVVGRVADRLRLHARLVTRDAARQRTRSAAAVAALTVVFVAPVAAATVVASEADAVAGRSAAAGREDVAIVTGPSYADIQLPPTAEMVETAKASLPVATERETPVSVLGRSEREWLYLEIGSSEAAGVVYGVQPGLLTPGAAQLLGLDEITPGTVVLTNGSSIDDLVGAGDSLVLGIEAPDADDPAPTRLQAVRAPTPVAAYGLPEVLLAPDVAQRLRLEPVGAVVALELARPLTDPEADAAQRSGGTTLWGLNLAPPHGVGGNPLVPMAIVAGMAILLAIVITAMTTALAATESDRDLALVTAVGAEPRLRRRFHGLQAWYHAGIAAIVATPVGILLVAATRRSGPVGDPLVVPWAVLIGIVVLSPLVVGAVFRLVMRPAPVGAPGRRLA